MLVSIKIWQQARAYPAKLKISGLKLQYGSGYNSETVRVVMQSVQQAIKEKTFIKILHTSDTLCENNSRSEL